MHDALNTISIQCRLLFLLIMPTSILIKRFLCIFIIFIIFKKCECQIKAPYINQNCIYCNKTNSLSTLETDAWNISFICSDNFPNEPSYDECNIYFVFKSRKKYYINVVLHEFYLDAEVSRISIDQLYYDHFFI